MSASRLWLVAEVLYVSLIVGWILAVIWPHYKPEYVFSLKDQSAGWLACRYLILVFTTVLLPEAWARCDSLRHKYWSLIYTVCCFTVIAAISSYDFVAWLIVVGGTYAKLSVARADA